jgi:hypothetical protein
MSSSRRGGTKCVNNVGASGRETSNKVRLASQQRETHPL